MDVKIPAWSFSSMKYYEQCPKKYYHVKVVREFKEDQNAEHLLYGVKFHKAAELYIKDGTPIPEEFSYAKEVLAALKSIEGDKLCEYEMGLTANLEPCEYRDPMVWWRGVADLIILRGDTAYVLDYKTGKSAKYADMDQMEIMSLAIFKHFPQVTKIKAGLLFVIAKEFIKTNYFLTGVPEMWAKWLGKHAAMTKSYTSNVWNPKTSGLCNKHCVVVSCVHNGRE